MSDPLLHAHVYETLPDGREVCFECNAPRPTPGGARPGAGRPKSGRARYEIRVKPEIVARVDALVSAGAYRSRAEAVEAALLVLLDE